MIKIDKYKEAYKRIWIATNGAEGLVAEMKAIRECIEELEKRTEEWIIIERHDDQIWALYTDEKKARTSYRDTYPDPRDKSLTLLVYDRPSPASKRANCYNETRDAHFRPVKLRDLKGENHDK